MKRLVLAILVALSMLSLSACATPKTTESPQAPAPATTQAPPPTTTESVQAPTPIQQITPTPAAAIGWDKAKYHIGERATVCGPVVDSRWATGSKGKPTFLNIGKPYPDPDRFTVVIWIENRSKFPQAPEVYYRGKTVCVTGLITEYRGIPEIEVKDPSQIRVQ